MTKPQAPKTTASTSFNAEEVSALHELLTALTQKKDVSVMASSKALHGVARKLPAMKAAIERQKAKRAT